MCCQKNSIMSVFCSNILISAPECWKYILRGPVFKFFPHFQCLQIASLPHVFFFFAYSKAFATYIILLKTLHRPPKTAILKLKIDWILHFIERNWKLISVMYVPQISLCLVYILRVGRWFFFKRIYTPGESFPSRLNQSRFNQPINQSIKSIRLFSYFTCNHLDKDKKIQMLVMTLRPLHNLVQKCVKKTMF